ncbi:hypothetical protein AKUH4B114J_14910 [Apilactobacillus kunkeei]|uniref:hypothetical protein n=1 Tax=Apilactobacillus kunkeei TaxID=148814 RepID=UPI001C6F7CE4|nr:hypothetical protein [Apilactobacillus kunkeei]MBX8454882.1 hypothetical protein [Apilactobacillus kunkeei]QYU54433.1 hypothetical protein K2W87_07415 [Apilactobacillus kunkeei]CAI2667341.1 hypothetical protein AKUH3B202M_14910 [Apilactobacillus kunkeei]CAI2670186.1 hypothetical protein AKUH3B101X_14890 [Apilactobacillus kunkeei]CAI2670583.1 hypothetical protein AKUH2B105J_14920 [Apilactobacillus kunkeei]
MKKKVAAAFAAVGAVFLIGTTVHASAKQTYTNRSEFVNVYKYGKLRHGRHTMMRYRYFKRIGHMHVGNRVRFNGSNFLFLPKLGGYVPEYQLKLVKPVKKVKKAKKVVVKPKKTTTKKKKATKKVKRMVIADTSASGFSLSNRMLDDSAVSQPKQNVTAPKQQAAQDVVKPKQEIVKPEESRRSFIDQHDDFNQSHDNGQKVTQNVTTDGSGAALSNNSAAATTTSSVSDGATTTFSTTSTASNNK